MKPILLAMLALASIQWEKSTGPKSEEGKTRSAMRGFKGATGLAASGASAVSERQG